ncbi:App1 family protein [Timonella senegalensis]|uniref:App1 family protein n=1 Tax=Timonella senegalensis TaxID=1465825 RepID=UPI002FDEE3C3
MGQEIQPVRVSSRPHWARRTETSLVRFAASFFRKLGWQERIEPFVGYGAAAQTDTFTFPDSATFTLVDRADGSSHPDGIIREDPAADVSSSTPPQGWVRVLARVMVSPKKRASIFRTSALKNKPVHQRAVRGWRSFFTVQSPETPVFVTVGDRTFRVVADEGGYIDVVLPSTFDAGWHEVSLTLTHSLGQAHLHHDEVVPAEQALEDAESSGSGRPLGRGGATVGVRVIGRSETMGLISDLDDTAIVTTLPRPFLAAWNSFVMMEKARQPVPGMSELYRRLEETVDSLPVIYLSTGAWNVVPAMIRFLARYRFPLGPMLMTDWGPTNTGFFRSGREHKERALARLATDFPSVKWILSGDDGQHDPVIYQEFTASRPEHVKAVAIRQLSPSEAVLSHGTTGANPANKRAEVRGHFELPEVPVFEGGDGYALMDRFSEYGLLNTRGTR